MLFIEKYSLMLVIEGFSFLGIVLFVISKYCGFSSFNARNYDDKPLQPHFMLIRIRGPPFEIMRKCPRGTYEKEKTFQFGSVSQSLRICTINNYDYLPLERNRNKAVSTGSYDRTKREGKTYWDAVRIFQGVDTVYIDTNDFTFAKAIRSQESQKIYFGLS